MSLKKERTLCALLPISHSPSPPSPSSLTTAHAFKIFLAFLATVLFTRTTRYRTSLLHGLLSLFTPTSLYLFSVNLSLSHLAAMEDQEIDCVTYLVNTPSGPCLTLPYNSRRLCLCDRQHITPIASTLCPYHGPIDRGKKLYYNLPPGTQKKNKRRRDRDRNAEDQDYTPRPRRKIAHTPQKVLKTPTMPPSPQPSRAIDPGRGVEARTFVHLQKVEIKEKQTFDAKNLPDQDPKPQSNIRRRPLLELDFLQANPDARKLIYRYLLVPSSETITFPEPQNTQTFRQLNLELQPAIILTNSQVYRECRPILYGENNFIAADPSDFFAPTGIEGLRASTAQRIKHISLVRRGGREQCDFSSQTLAEALHRMTLKSPGFLNIRTLTIRFEVTRPASINLEELQMYLNSHNAHRNAVAIYNKTGVVLDAAARVAHKALTGNSPFQGLTVLDDTEYYVEVPGGEDVINSVIEVCLFRTDEPNVNFPEETSRLRKVILQMLGFDQGAGLSGADREIRRFIMTYPNQLVE